VSMRAPVLLRVVLFREGVWCDVCVHKFGRGSYSLGRVFGVMHTASGTFVE